MTREEIENYDKEKVRTIEKTIKKKIIVLKI